MREFMQGTVRPLAVFMICVFVFLGCERGEAPAPAREEARKAVPAEAPESRGAAPAGESKPAMAPDFELTTFEGERVRLSEKLGSPVVLNFWASWCGPCRLEAPALKDAFDLFAKRGVAFLGVAVQDNDDDSRAFIKEYGWTFAVGPDSTGEIMRAYRVFGIPKTYIIDPDGAVAFIATGAVSTETLTREIEKLL